MYHQSRYPSDLANRYRLAPKSEPRAGLFAELLNCLRKFGISPAVVWLQLCAIASLLTQGVADVLWPNGWRAPVGVSGVLVGQSGCGKSLIYYLLMAAIEDYFRDAVMSEPSAQAGILIEDATLPALIAHLKASPYAAIFSDEAGALIHLQGAAATLAKLTDGTPLRRSRVSSEHMQLMGHRLVMLYMLQPWTFETDRLFSMAPGGIGLANRCFFSTPTPIVGSLHQLSLPDSVAVQHRSRAYELLDATLQNARTKPPQLPALQLSSDARQFFEHAADESRRQANDAGSPSAANAEYLARHGERILRFAGALHLYDHGLEGLGGEISLSTIQTTDQIGRESINAFQRLSYRPTQAQKDALTIAQALHSHFSRTGCNYIKLSDLRRYAPNLGLTRQRVNKVLPELVTAGQALIVTSGKDDFVRLIAAPIYSPWDIR